ncbi:uncharacterized protein LOC125582251 [Brassica napus]|uniref:uncharacterized protein LOC125582251 n=1 Tax=Brassica napus TaxID=3708 RepID=UPI0020790B99|nr:uncharacterized protein LOC125582251 [Brassica napus]
MKDRILEGPTAAPLIERVLAETLKTPFSWRITDVRYRPAEKIRLPTYAEKANPTVHITAFNIAMGRTNFSEEERDACYCRLFVESLQGPALGWFTGLERDSIHNFHDLTTAFLKQYIMFTKQGATLSDLCNLSQGASQSLRDFMEKFKTVASKVQIPDSVAIDALMNTLYFKSLFREDLYRNPTTSLQDAIARSNNFIRMEEDTAAILKKLNTAAKPTTAPKAPEARQEPRQQASGNKSNQPKSFVYVVEDKNPSPGSIVVVREKGWNVFENDERPQSSSAPSTSSPGSAEPNLWCSYHKSKVHDTRNCMHLVDALFSSYGNGNVELPKPRPNNAKSWSKNKERKAQKNQDKSGTRPKHTEDDKPEERDEDEGEAQVEEEEPRNRRRVQVILARPNPSSDEKEDKRVHDSHENSSKRPNENVGPEGSNDLRNKLRQKSQTTDRIHDFKNDIRSIIEESKARKVEDSSARSHLRL